ncbi:MAG TPA: alpha/beta hydrolase [Thermoanaerobaculia bacterium]
MRRSFLAAILFLVLVSASRFSNAQSTTPAAAAAPAPEIRFEPYAVVSRSGPPVVRGELGRFAVPENRSSAGSRSIELAFVRLRSMAKRPGAPVVWLAGGPGRSGIEDLDTPLLLLLLELRKHSDVLVLDQRGTGLSKPRLDCPGAITFRKDIPLDREIVVGALEEASRRCSELWRGRGVDLAGYNTRESAEDVEDLRRAVGAPKLKILAGSYGTHLAMALFRAHGDTIERAALVGVVGPDQLRRVPSDTDEQLATIAALVRADRSLSKRMPDFLATVRQIRDRLAERPAIVRVSGDEGVESVTVGRFDLAWFTRSLLSSRGSIARLPAVFADMADGDFSELGATSLAWRMSPLPSGSMFLMRCASGATAVRLARIEAERESALLGDAADLAEDRVCRAWGVPRLSDEFRQPVSSAVPTLFVTGTLDGDTPERNTREILGGFSRAARLKIDGAAHSLLGLEGENERDAIAEFLSGGGAKQAVVRLPAIPFAPPGSRGTFLADGRTAASALFGGGMP